MSQLEDLERAIYAEAEQKLKSLLGDLWLEYKDDALKWAKTLASLEWAIAKGEHPFTNQIAYDHLAKIGIPCFVQRVRGRVQEETVNFLTSLLQMLLDQAVAIGTAYLDKKINKLI